MYGSACFASWTLRNEATINNFLVESFTEKHLDANLILIIIQNSYLVWKAARVMWQPFSRQRITFMVWGSIHSSLVPTSALINKNKHLNQLRRTFLVRWLPSVNNWCTKCTAVGALVTYVL